MALFAFLVRRDLAARDKQMARMLREEKLGVLQLELANRKVGLDHAAQIVCFQCLTAYRCDQSKHLHHSFFGLRGLIPWL